MPWYAKRSVYRVGDNVTRRPCPCSQHPTVTRPVDEAAPVAPKGVA